ncbi:MAG: hypothetical protein QXT86_13645, partial [Archaeoglobaceae archaeon]
KIRQLRFKAYIKKEGFQMQRVVGYNIRHYKQVLTDLASVYGANAEYIINKLDEYIRLAFQSGIDVIDFGLFRLEKIDGEIKLIFLNT